MTVRAVALTMQQLAALTVLLFVGLTLSAASDDGAAAATESPPPPPTIQSISSDLEYDENNRLAKHTFVYDASNPLCQTMVKQHLIKSLQTVPKEGEHFHVAAVEGHAFERVLRPYQTKDSGCLAACIERGVEIDYAAFVMPESVYDSAILEDEQGMVDWFKLTCSHVEVCLMNYHSKESPLHVYWRNPNGDLQRQFSIEYGERKTRCFDTFIGHEFVARDESDPNNPVVVGELTVEFQSVKAWGNSPPSDERSPAHNFEAEIERTLRNEWKRHQRITRTFSPLGFKKGRLPNDVFAALSAFYYNNAKNVVREEWKNKGVFVNWWETDVLFVQMPWGMKKTMQSRLRIMVEQWAGVPVEQTVMYGMRQYTQGARLLTHVDRHETHAVSLIVNIAQGNLTEPWPVEVQDHADRIHEVVMEPGDVVYYESAKCLHGRNRPMMGPQAYYVNMFTHYKPVQEGQWWSEENPEGTPEAVLGDKPVKEECRLNHLGNSSVQCDNPALGPNISPELFQVKDPDDLITWWRLTGPKVEADQVSSIPDTSTISEGEL